MAITANELTSDSATNATSANTASISLSANALCLVAVASRTNITADPNVPTITGFTTVGSIVYDTDSASRQRISVLRRLGSASSGALTISFGGQTQTDIVWGINEFVGVDTSGTNGSGAVVQAVTNNTSNATAGSLTVTLAAFGSVNNATYGAFGWDSSATPTEGSGFTLLDFDLTGSNTALGDEWKASNDTTVDISLSSNSKIGGVAIEIKAAAGTVVKDLIGVGMIPFAR